MISDKTGLIIMLCLISFVFFVGMPNTKIKTIDKCKTAQVQQQLQTQFNTLSQSLYAKTMPTGTMSGTATITKG